MSERAPAPTAAVAPPRGRWLQLVVGMICMAMIANLQYGWTLFVTPINDKYHWGRAAIQVAFTLFVLTETWLVPVEGYLVDKFGPRVVVIGSSFLVASAWVINAYADSLPLLYFGAVIGGIGAGGVYGTCVGNALKWFPDKRGLAAGLTAMGFGAGSAFTVVPIANMIKGAGYETTFLRFGIAQGAVVFILGWLLKQAPAGMAFPTKAGAAPRIAQREYSPTEMVRTPAFWVLYVMFVLMATGGLVATAQLTPIARDFQIADIPVSLAGLTLPALSFALAIDRIMNGVSRSFFGWVSDHLGRENTMFLAFFVEGVSIFLLSKFGQNPTAFVLITALVYFAWGEIYSLMPATCADTYGRKYAASNAGLLYTAKGTASLLVPYTSVIAASGRGWPAVFVVASVMNFVAAFMALFVLKPMRKRMRDAQAAAPPPVPVAMGVAGATATTGE